MNNRKPNRKPRPPFDPDIHFWPRVEKSDGCWMWIPAKAARSKFYYGSCYGYSAHRVSFELANGIPLGSLPGSVYICHRCDRPGCVRPDHLFAGDAKVNQVDRAQKGRADTRRRFKADFAYARELREQRMAARLGKSS